MKKITIFLLILFSITTGIVSTGTDASAQQPGEWYYEVTFIAGGAGSQTNIKSFHSQDLCETKRSREEDEGFSQRTVSDQCMQAQEEEINPNTITTTSYQLLEALPGVGQEFDPTEAGAFGRYLNIIFYIGLGLATVAAVVMISYSGILYMTTESFTGKEEARNKLTYAILGLLLALSIILILQTINPNLTGTEPNIDEASLENSDFNTMETTENTGSYQLNGDFQNPEPSNEEIKQVAGLSEGVWYFTYIKKENTEENLVNNDMFFDNQNDCNDSRRAIEERAENQDSEIIDIMTNCQERTLSLAKIEVDTDHYRGFGLAEFTFEGNVKRDAHSGEMMIMETSLTIGARVGLGTKGVAEEGQGRSEDEKTPKGEFRIHDVNQTRDISTGTDDPVVTNNDATNVGSAFIRTNARNERGGLRGIGFHGSVENHLGSTNGCLRMHNDDLIILAPYMKNGVPVIIK